MRRSKVLLLFAALALGALAPPARADDAPAWLKQASAAAAPGYPKDVPAVVLLDENTITVGDDGRTTETARFVVRVLAREGRAAARASAYYVPRTSKVRDMKAWLVQPSGQVRAYGKGDIVDRTTSSDDVYNESRLQAIAAGDEADAGAVFGCEYTIEDRPLFAQEDWLFQARLPVVRSRVSLVLPEGWRAEAVTFNHTDVAPSVSGSTYAWELSNLPPIPPEPDGPPVTNLAPRLAITWFAPTGAASARGFSNWTQVSQWVTNLAAAQATPDAAISAKARELTAGATTDLERIRAVGRYVQSVNYISIQTNLARGGGYTPHAAAEVFAKSYGDCKDKANLMLTMLKSVGIGSYLVAIFAGDPNYVREAWASPAQFNHCIIAVRIPEGTDVPSTIDHPSLGRLLVFDPTDTNTPVGDLPDHEQGSFALLVAGDAGGLVRMPEMAPEANRLERETEVALTPDGAVSGRIREHSVGAAAVSERRLFAGLARPDYDRRITRWIASSVTMARVEKIDPADDRSSNRFKLDVAFAANQYAQVMQGRLFVYKPALVSRLETLSLTDAKRTQPVVIDAEAFSETARIKLPEGFTVDEMPDAVTLATRFGTYATTYTVDGGTLVFTRSMVLRRATIPASDYSSVRGFFEQIRAAEQAPVVLVRK
jgi:transglutaminase-like putative cysteine protease